MTVLCQKQQSKTLKLTGKTLTIWINLYINKKSPLEQEGFFMLNPEAAAAAVIQELY